MESCLSGPTNDSDDLVEVLLLMLVDVENSGVLSDEEFGPVLFDCYFRNVERGAFVKSVFRSNEGGWEWEINGDWHDIDLRSLFRSLFSSGKQVLGNQFVHLIHSKKLIELK